MLNELYAKIDAMPPERREKLLYFILPLYMAELGHPEAVAEALEGESRYTFDDMIEFKKVLELLKR